MSHLLSPSRRRSVSPFDFAATGRRRRQTSFATIAYRWHPLFGRRLQISRFVVELTAHFARTSGLIFAASSRIWMFDESYCAGMALGAPDISIEGLNAQQSSWELKRRTGWPSFSA
jgi:hypothetical protein